MALKDGETRASFRDDGNFTPAKLESAVGVYNRTPHNTIGMSPSKAVERRDGKLLNSSELVRTQTKGPTKDSGMEAPKFKTGDLVRVGIRKRSLGQKADQPQYTRQLFRVKRVNSSYGARKKDEDMAKSKVTTYNLEKIPEEQLVDPRYYTASKNEKSRDKQFQEFLDKIAAKPPIGFRAQSLVWANEVEDQFGDKMDDLIKPAS